MVDLVSHACPPSERPAVLTYGAGPDPVPWVSQSAVPYGPVPRARPSARISGTISNVRDLEIEVRRACLAPGTRLRMDVSVDGPTLVRFSDGRPPVRLTPRAR